MLKPCEVCGDLFKVKPSHAPIRFCCGRKCQHKRFSLIGTEERQCSQCQQIFRTGRKTKKRFCGVRCSAAFTSQRPPKNVLQDLYLTQNLTAREIATRFRVNKISVIRWMNIYGIELRPKGRGLANRGIVAPSREDLHNLVHVIHLGYKEIANLFGVDGSAIMHWLIKHNIERPKRWDTIRKTRNFRYPTKEELEDLYIQQGLSTKAIGRLFQLSDSCIAKCLIDSGLPVRASGWNYGKRFIGKDGHALRSTYELSVCDWLTANNISHEYEPSLSFSKHFHSDFLADGFYIEIWGVINSAIYTKRKKRKRDLYRANDIPLIELNVYHFNKASKHNWSRILERYFLPKSFPLISALPELSVP